MAAQNGERIQKNRKRILSVKGSPEEGSDRAHDRRQHIPAEKNRWIRELLQTKMPNHILMMFSDLISFSHFDNGIR